MYNKCINGVKDDKGKGFTSRKRICFIESYLIALDSKARLVLPLEIREALGIKTNGKITISVSTIQDGKVILKLSKASDSDIANSISFSKNGKYLRGEKYEKSCTSSPISKSFWRDRSPEISGLFKD